MPFTLQIPFATAERTVAPGGVPITLRAYQPVVWVRLAPWDPPLIPVGIPFPAVADTGNNHSFLMPGSLFRAWTGLEIRDLEVRHNFLVNGVLLKSYPFNLDLVRVRDGQPTERTATRLQADRGIVIVPEEHEARFPRMPVLGVRTLCLNRITFTLNGARQTFTLSQPRPRAA